MTLLFLSVLIIVGALPLYKPSEFADFSAANWFSYTIAVHILRGLEARLLPSQETIIALGPWDAFSTIMMIAAGVALLVVLPYATVEVLRWSWTAIRGSTRWVLRWLIPLSVGLFLSGVTLAFLVLPWLYGFAYQIQGPAGVSGTVSLNEFVGQTLFFVLALGISFEIPVVTYGLGLLGILSTKLMKKTMVPAFFGCTALAFAISPAIFGGLVEIPMAFGFFGLYLMGFLMVRRAERSRVERIAAEVTGIGAG